MYHHLRELSPYASAAWRLLTVRPSDFESQVAYLAKHDYHTVYFSDVVAYFDDGRPLPANPVIITFDDAWQEDFAVAYPILRKCGMAATFFIPTDWIGHSSMTLTWAEVEEMDRCGMEFGSHTANHHLLAKEKPDEALFQLLSSKATLQQHVTKPVTALAYPGGSFSAEVARLVEQAGYGAAVGVKSGILQDKAHRYAMWRLNIPYGLDLGGFATRLQAQLPPAGPVPATVPQVGVNRPPADWRWYLLDRRLQSIGEDPE
jgi:peptidoglycan/xylan/chitin deacetylase (PgdA/CDA1 family)